MPDASWSFAAASLGGTSYLRLPRLLQWFTGNIGFHHAHHVNPRIPNYRLEECHNADAGFQLASTLTLRTALQASAMHCGTAIWSDWCRFVSPPPIVDACGASTSIPGIDAWADVPPAAVPCGSTSCRRLDRNPTASAPCARSRTNRAPILSPPRQLQASCRAGRRPLNAPNLMGQGQGLEISDLGAADLVLT